MSNFSIEELRSLVKENLKQSIPSLMEDKGQQGVIPGLKKDTKQQTITLPKFRISEDWGKPNSKDRQIITRYMQNLAGKSLSEKLASVENFITECDEACIRDQPIEAIMSNLVFLEVMASLIQDFNDKVAGFLFEAFLAAIIEGEQVETVGGRYQPIEDLLDAEGKPLSLKLIKATPGYVGGSLPNLKTATEKYGNVKYIVAHKKAEGGSMAMDFFVFTVGFPGDDADIIVESKQDWPVRSKDYSQYKVASFNAGSREDLEKLAQRYTEKLSGSLSTIFGNLQELTDNINLYYAGDTEKGYEASKNAAVLKRETNKLV
jgi:hypothetical protein